MLFVTGKGGVGKTTTAAALAVAATAQRRRTVVVELAGQARMPALFGVPAGRPGEEIEVADRLWATTIEPWRVLEEWIGKILGSRSVTGVLTRSNFFRGFADAAPGGAELGTITKIWELAQRERWDKRAQRYDLVIVDAPGTGHAIGLLRTPKTFADIARVGPIASQAERVREWLGDWRQTAYVAVALAAEMPVNETLDLGQRLRKGLGRRVETIVANGILPHRFKVKELRAIEKAAKAAQTDGGATRGDLVAAARMTRGAQARAKEQREQLGRLREGLDAPVHELPFVFAPAVELEHVELLAERLEDV